MGLAEGRTTTSIAASPSPKERCLPQRIGTYELQSACTFLVTLENGQLMFGPAASQQKLPLSAESEAVFYSKAQANVEVTFLKNAAGEVTGLTFRQGPIDMTGVRK